MSDSEKSNIVSLSEVLESKIVKERELEYYYEQLKEIQRKIGFLETDLKLTKQIIHMIEGDKILEVDNSVPLIGIRDDDTTDQQ
jgi:hypothetical protein